MVPRKRQRPNPAAAESKDDSNKASLPSPLPAAASDPTGTDRQQEGPASSQNADGSDKGSQGLPKQVRKSQSWYGSWPRAPKATASTSVAKENILGGGIKPIKSDDLSKYDRKTDSGRASVRSVAAPSGLPEVPENGAKKHVSAQETGTHASSNVRTAEDTGGDKADAAESGPEQAQQPREQLPKAADQTSNTPSGWLGWWSQTPFLDTQAAPSPPVPPADESLPPRVEEQSKDDQTPRPSTPSAQTAEEDGPTHAPQSASQAPGWFGFWSSTVPSRSAAETMKDIKDGAIKNGASDSGRPTDGEQSNQPDEVTMDDAPPEAKPRSEPQSGSAWAFWSKQSPPSKKQPHPDEQGEIAVIGESSEAHPTPMAEGDVTSPKATKAKESGGMLTWKRSNKRVRPPSMDVDAQSPTPSGVSTPREAQTPTAAKVDSSSKSISESESLAKTQPNLLLPSFSGTYQMKQDPSIIKQIAQLLLRSQQPPANHVYRSKEIPTVRKAISIGVHGLFPATYLRPMIGQPTGTSIRFATLGAEAIRRWTERHGLPECEIEKVALEGEGKVKDRVDNLWKLMLNWVDHIRHADLVLFSCHSQGVPVSIMLLEKLIDLGILTTAKIGVCAMAGVGLGPFPDYKSGIFMGSAAELWEFGDPDSVNSLRFESCLKKVVDYGARVTFVGSIDDQLVPMESAIYSPANHPHIYRAVFIDGRIHAPDFIAHLVGFALKLRNLGISDHGLIRELSAPLAGSLYSGEGHSRLYYDDQVYDLAISHALETTSIPQNQQHPCHIHHRNKGAIVGANAQTTNPYILPWIMRGLLEEDFVKTELSNETKELLRQFDDWKPTNKALKDVKYRLEAVRSKL